MSKNCFPKTISFSVAKGYEKEVAHLNEQPNKSRYILELIRKDMERQTIDNQILDIVRHTMQNLSNNTNIQKTNKQSMDVNNSAQNFRKKGVLSIVQE